jgi:hypothetical protein
MPNPLEKMAASAAGALKDAKAGAKGLTGVFLHLMEEHGKVGALIKRVALSSDEGVRSKLYPTIRSELLAHETGELNAVYPVLAEYPETRDIAADHSIQASDLQAAIAELDAISVGDAEWAPAFKRLAALVQQHVDIEESRYFPLAQKVIGEERAQQLLHSFEAAKRVS